MSNLSALMQDGVKLGEPAPQFESMTESQMVALLTVAMEDVMYDGILEAVLTEGCGGKGGSEEEEDGSLMEGVLPDDMPIMEKTIVRLDKNAKKQRAYKLAILQCAKDDDSKDYKKLETIWRMEKFLFRKLEKKYAPRAKSRMKQTAAKASGKNGIVAKVKSALSNGGKTRSQRETEKALAGQTKPPTQIKNQFTAIATKLGAKVNNTPSVKAVK